MPRQSKVIGYEVEVYTDRYPALGRTLDTRIEYGASPVRDRNSRQDCVFLLKAAGIPCAIFALHRDGTRTEVEK